MSRIGKKPIIIPENITVKQNGNSLEIKGEKGTLTVKTHPDMSVEINGNNIIVTPKKKDRLSRSLHGLTRTLISNAIDGVGGGFTKQLEMKGVGYKAEVKDKELVLNLGFSHPVIFNIPDTISIEVKKNTITITGPDKQLVGETAARIRRLRPPEPYKGKGIKYVDEVIRRKAGKAAKAAEGA